MAPMNFSNSQISNGACELQEASQNHVHRRLVHFREAEVCEAAWKHLAKQSRGQVHTIVEALALPYRIKIAVFSMGKCQRKATENKDSTDSNHQHGEFTQFTVSKSAGVPYNPVVEITIFPMKDCQKMEVLSSFCRSWTNSH